MWWMFFVVIFSYLSYMVSSGICIPNGVGLLHKNSVFYGWTLISNNAAGGIDISVVMASGTFADQVRLVITEPRGLPTGNTHLANAANTSHYHYQYLPSFKMNCSAPATVYNLQVTVQVSFKTINGSTGIVGLTWSPQFICSACTQVTPCDFNPCGMDEQCAILNGLPECRCRYGMKYDALYNCVTDPCTPSPCASSARCVVNSMDFTCQCPVGYSYDTTMGCVAPSNMTDCWRALAEASFWQKPHIPQCTADGQYSPTQCSNTLGYCWCVTKTGNEISGTRVSVGSSNLNCSSVYTSCELDRGLAVVGTKQFEAYWPTCDSNGLYTPQQCNWTYWAPSCWCVDGTGHALPGTMVYPEKGTDNPPDLKCTDFRNLTACQLAHHLASQSSAFVPQCDSNGNYATQQCLKPTRECWCVDSSGRELLDTRVVSLAPSWPPNLDCDGRIPFAASLTVSSAVATPDPCFGYGCQANMTCDGRSGTCVCINGGWPPNCKPCEAYSCNSAGTCAASPSGNQCQCLNYGHLPDCVSCQSKSVGLVEQTGVTMGHLVVDITGRELQLQYSTPGYIMSEAAGYAGLTPCPIPLGAQSHPSLLFPMFAKNPGATFAFHISLDRLTQSECPPGSTVDIFVCAYAKIFINSSTQYADTWAGAPTGTTINQSSQAPHFNYTWLCGCEAKHTAHPSMDTLDSQVVSTVGTTFSVSPAISFGIAVGVCSVTIVSGAIFFVAYQRLKSPHSTKFLFAMDPAIALLSPVARSHYATATPLDGLPGSPGSSQVGTAFSPGHGVLPPVADLSKLAIPVLQGAPLLVSPSHL